ncbi:MAG: ferritin family protein, partial [candidate division WOR-3 bacterium]
MTVSRLNSVEIFGIAIKSEIEAARAYQQIATLVARPDVKRKLRFLREEERRHRSLLEEMYRRDYPDIKLILPAQGLAPTLSTAVDQNLPVPRLFALAMKAERQSEKFYAENARRSESQSG